MIQPELNSVVRYSELNSLHHSLVLRFVEKCKFPKDGSSPKSLRYIGRYVLLKPLSFPVFLGFD